MPLLINQTLKRLLDIHTYTLTIVLTFDFCRFCVVIRGFHPRHNGQWPPTSKDFLSQNVSITFIFLSWFLRKSVFPFECSVLNKGTTGTVFITSLVWRGPWLGIEPGTSRTRSHYYTTRLSRRRFANKMYMDSVKNWRILILGNY